jgi:hypothetical protein
MFLRTERPNSSIKAASHDGVVADHQLVMDSHALLLASFEKLRPFAWRRIPREYSNLPAIKGSSNTAVMPCDEIGLLGSSFRSPLTTVTVA